MVSKKTLFFLLIFYLVASISADIGATGYDGYEYDNYFTQAKLIWNGPAQQHTIYPVGDEDWVKFSIPRDCNVIIETSGIAGDTRMWLYDGTNPAVTTIYQNNFNANPGWNTQGQWAFGQPTGQGGDHGYPDPISGHTGNYVYGYNLNGDYPDNLNSTQYLTTTAINCSGYGMVKLRFWRWLGVERYTYDEASIEVSNDGIYWYNVWQNPDSEVADSGWVHQEFSISYIADNQPTVYIRWGMGPTDSSWTYCGWNIDDVEITGVSYATGLTLLEYDDDSGEGYFSYIDRVCSVDPLPAGTYYVQIDEYNDDEEIAEYFLNVIITPCVQRTIYVDDDAPNDPLWGDPSISDPLEDGTTAHPYDAIQEAINVSVDGDTVLVKDGTYSGAGNYNINFSWDFGYEYHRSIHVKSENGADSTIIDLTGRDYGFYLNHGETANSIIEGFTIMNSNYAGISLYHSSPIIRNCVLRWNEHIGITSYGGTPIIENCKISDNGNMSSMMGGGIYCGDSASMIWNCIIANNAGGSFSAGLMFEDCWDGDPVVYNTLIYGNVCNDTGGGIFSMWSNPQFMNCVIMGNYSANEGGGIYLMITSNPAFYNCTITANEAGGNGGGMYSTGNSNPVFTNTILWNDYPNEIQLHPTEPGNPVVSYCDIRGGWSGSGSNNINADPKFIDFGMDPIDIPMLFGRLASGSPCIDAGTSNVGFNFDIDEKIRWDDPLTTNTGGGTEPYYDIGAYEFKAFYVATNGNDGWDGLRPTWNGASGPKKTIQAGLDVAGDGEQVIVLPGTYTGTGNRDLNYYGRDLHLISEKGALQTIIDCQGSSSNEHRGILFNNGETQRAFIKGFSIKNGYSTIYGNGGAIACNYSNPGIFDCILSYNSSLNGGAINCSYSSPTIANCIIRNNEANGNWPNGGYGGGINFSDHSGTLIKNCLITSNWARGSGGGINCGSAWPRIYNSTIYGNGAYDSGDGIYSGVSPYVKNCIVWDNEIFVYMFTTATVEYSDVESGSYEPWFGVGCIDTNPYFVSGPLHNYYLSQTAAGQLSNSPCVDAGSAPVEDVGMSNYSTRTDGVLDSGQVDMGYHARYALRIYSMVRGTGSVTIYWNGITRVSYVVEWSTDMLLWNPVSVGAVSQWTDTNIAGYTKKFYRVREQ